MIRHRIGNYGDTFKWLFEPGQTHGFREWLTSDNSLYWISGKPGSGKSSLINYIVEHLEPGEIGRGLLEQWAAPARLLSASVFFYKPAADQLQKGYEGLWRSLCFQLLERDEVLVDKLLTGSDCPQAISRQLSIDIDSKHRWMVHELEVLFFHLLQKTDCRVFVLFDGLDEFVESQLQLLNSIKQLAGLPGLKICCSSRPDAPFDPGLARVPNLKVHDLTDFDIKSAVERRLVGTEASRLVQEVVRKADGVFLWAHLVTEDIRTCMMAGDSIERLEELVYDAPSDMLSLFAAMLGRVHPSFIKRPKPYLQCLCICFDADGVHVPAYLSDFLFVDTDQTELDDCLRRGFTEKYVSKLVESARTIRQQVLAHCAGLVQIGSDGSWQRSWDVSFNQSDGTPLDLSSLRQLSRVCVEFIHRCAYDFLKDDPAGRAFVASCSLPRDIATLALLRASVATMRLDKNYPTDCSSADDCFLPRIGRLLEQLEKCPALYPEYHLLATQFLDCLLGSIDHRGQYQDRPRCTSWDIDGNLSPTSIPTSRAHAWHYTRSYGLFSWFKTQVKGWPRSQQQTAALLVWSQAARSMLNEGVDYWLELLADVQDICGDSRVTATFSCSDLVMTGRSGMDRLEYAIPPPPLWAFVVASMVRRLLFSYRFASESWVPATLKMLDTLVEPGLSAAEPLGLALFVPNGGIDKKLNVCPSAGQGRASVPRNCCAATLKGTLGSMVSFLMPGIGHQAFAPSESEHCPQITHWKPRGIDLWLELQDGPSVTIHSIHEDFVEKRGACECHIATDQLVKLDRSELAIVRKYHIETEPGHYKFLWGDRNFSLYDGDGSGAEDKDEGEEESTDSESTTKIEEDTN